MSAPAPHHVNLTPEDLAGNDGRGRFLLLPGSDARARQFGERLSGLRVCESPRQLNAYLGTLERDGVRLDVGAVPTGMGTPSLDIVATELIQLGARRLLRVGTAGSLQHGKVRAGDLVVASSAVRDEAASRAYAPVEVPAVAHPDWITALTGAARAAGHGGRTFVGPVHTKDSLFAREYQLGPLAEEHRDYLRVLSALGVLASEMESAHLFVLAAVHGADRTPLDADPASADVVKCGALLAVIGGDSPFGTADEAKEAEERAIDVALSSLLALHRLESR